MHPNEELIRALYAAFAERDAAAMAACYHPSASFSDPAFGTLYGPQIGAMWAMLCARGFDLVVRLQSASADATSGTARWDAVYTFSKTGRLVHNVIQATFQFEAGKIVRHVDRFDMWKWSRMALGPLGALLGWTPLLRSSVRRTARRDLMTYIARHPELAASDSGE